MRGNAHVRFGGRAGETEWSKSRHRASVRPYYLKVREGGRVVSMAALVATGVALSGERRVLGLELAAGNDEGTAWPTFIRGLVERGLRGVRLVISDDHPGLVVTVREQLLGSGSQRCRVHFTRTAQDLVPRAARSMVASAIRAVFEQPDEGSAREQLDRVIDGIRPRFPQVAELLAEAEADLLAHFTFPETNRRQIRSTNPLERLNKEIQAPDEGGRHLPDPRVGAPLGRMPEVGSRSYANPQRLPRTSHCPEGPDFLFGACNLVLATGAGIIIRPDDRNELAAALLDLAGAALQTGGGGAAGRQYLIREPNIVRFGEAFAAVVAGLPRRATAWRRSRDLAYGSRDLARMPTGGWQTRGSVSRL
jgi:Transposase, Mutator family